MILITQILKKYEDISDNELNSELKVLRNKNNVKKIKKGKKIEKKGCLYKCFLLFILLLIPLIFATFFFYDIFKIKIINNN